MFNQSRLLNSFLYVLGKLEPEEREFHKIFKILWFADLSHIKEYGRSITSDEYIKMEYGPVPSFLYDILKGVRDYRPEFSKYAEDISVQGYKVMPKKQADMDYLSDSDIEELNKSIEENRCLTMGQLTDKSHSVAWKNSMDNQKIYIESILDEVEMPKEERDAVIESFAFSKAFAR